MVLGPQEENIEVYDKRGNDRRRIDKDIFSVSNRSFKPLVFADIPGLIEGAHEGAGLGDTFLRHIQRTKVLIHILDGTSIDAIADFAQINTEMALFDSNLKNKSQIVVFNKMDIPEVKEMWPAIKADLESHGFEPFAISAFSRTDLKPVLWKALELVKNAPEPEIVEQTPVYKPEEDPREFRIEIVEEGFRVYGKSIERAAKMKACPIGADTQKGGCV